MEIAVDIHDLTVAYDYKPVLWDVDLKLPLNKVICIVGPNGAGKSTLLKTILELTKSITGYVKFPMLETKKNKIAYVPQTTDVDWDFPTTVLDVVMMGRYGHLGWFKRPGKKEKEMSLSVLKKVGMLEYSKRQISELSGGQQQRVFLARALVQEADIYFLDEPLKGVDALTEKIVMELLTELKNEGKTIVVVHHDLRTVKEYFDWVVLLNLNVIASGNVDDVFTDENIKKTYNKVDVKYE